MTKRIVKPLAMALIAVLSFPAYAVGPGFYMGFMGGPATNGASEQQVEVINSSTGTLTTTTASPRSTQFGARGFLGYTFVKYAGIETGVSYYSLVNYSTKVPTSTSVKAGLIDWDVVGVGIFPIYTFSIYGKAGAAVVYEGASGTLRTTKYTTTVKPTASLGVSYDLSQNWVMDLSWNRVMAGSVIKNMTMYAVGISYHFVDKFCGQFLCDD